MSKEQLELALKIMAKHYVKVLRNQEVSIIVNWVITLDEIAEEYKITLISYEVVGEHIIGKFLLK